ncbi:Pyridoxamine 5'-phosphate oxidase-related, FMN-binding (plasmid) [Sinorhizobium sojae CCBAU 05684]|uniref:Pyridoxamine 5'-phosphate oxidase-related, FMN-binding n=1 Tax=Sinorhizobium sojae CCBAU 05684 TaxID=716928 RepID=A0A249PI09_9HYPH|nr:pyridoxamine 5'-phosphate oxidase family protein [Sinorhizobium sojae]ASY65570.1 Pyridoxamine 5'-phosphate oxidase-related, FMN-binding [Sinorhizobium sojae CCBAU 05684]
MFVREMSEQECLALVSSHRLGRLGCVKDNRPYVVPVYYAHVGQCLYSFSMPGQKIEWMRGNPHACVQVDEFLDRHQWKSVVVHGRYQELPERGQWHQEHLRAWSALEAHPNWWEPGGLKPAPQEILAASPHLFYCIVIDDVTGRAAVAEG